MYLCLWIIFRYDYRYIQRIESIVVVNVDISNPRSVLASSSERSACTSSPKSPKNCIGTTIQVGNGSEFPVCISFVCGALSVVLARRLRINLHITTAVIMFEKGALTAWRSGCEVLSR